MSVELAFDGLKERKASMAPVTSALHGYGVQPEDEAIPFTLSENACICRQEHGDFSNHEFNKCFRVLSPSQECTDFLLYGFN